MPVPNLTAKLRESLARPISQSPESFQILRRGIKGKQISRVRTSYYVVCDLNRWTTDVEAFRRDTRTPSIGYFAIVFSLTGSGRANLSSASLEKPSSGKSILMLFLSTALRTREMLGQECLTILRFFWMAG